MMITVDFRDLNEMMDFAMRLTGGAPAPTPVTRPATVPAPPAQTAAPVTPSPATLTAPPVTPAAVPAPPVRPAAVPTAPPVTPATVPVQQSVPTATQTYTLDDLAHAATTLMDAGKQPDLLQLLSSFRVESLPVLPPAQYGAFATALRGLGAQI